jgi:hypothetical protein
MRSNPTTFAGMQLQLVLGAVLGVAFLLDATCAQCTSGKEGVCLNEDTHECGGVGCHRPFVGSRFASRNDGTMEAHACCVPQHTSTSISYLSGSYQFQPVADSQSLCGMIDRERQ